MAADLMAIAESFRNGIYNLRTHAIEEMDNDMVTVDVLERAIGRDSPQVIEDYPSDPRGSSCLVLGWEDEGHAIHTVIGYAGDKPTVVTVYRPASDRWYDNFSKRR